MPCNKQQSASDVYYTACVFSGFEVLRVVAWRRWVYSFLPPWQPEQPVPSKQCVQRRHLGSPMACTMVSSLLKRSEVSPRRRRISSTMRRYCGESVVA